MDQVFILLLHLVVRTRTLALVLVLSSPLLPPHISSSLSPPTHKDLSALEHFLKRGYNGRVREPGVARPGAVGAEAVLLLEALILWHGAALARDGLVQVDGRDAVLGHDRHGLLVEAHLDVVDGLCGGGEEAL